jgi:hypothetical protein
MSETAMEPASNLSLERADAELLLASLEHRKERLCDIRQEICPPDDPEP